jgi:hypothetical protein
MEQNKTGKYFKYAIGEIILVVIGILIALQINNWNEQRKLEKSELSMLLDISNDLKESKKELDDVVKFNKHTAKAIQFIINHLENDLPYTKSLDTAFVSLRSWSSPYLTFTAYETLKTKGIDLIKNEALKKSIVNLYESHFAYIISDYDRSEWVLAQSVVYPLTVKHIKKINYATAQPNDYEALKLDNEFINMLNEINYMRIGGIRSVQGASELTQDLVDKIDEEINIRE